MLAISRHKRSKKQTSLLTTPTPSLAGSCTVYLMPSLDKPLHYPISLPPDPCSLARTEAWANSWASGWEQLPSACSKRAGVTSGKTWLSFPFHLTNDPFPPSALCPRRAVRVLSSLRQLNPGSHGKPSIYLSCWVHQRLKLQPLAWLINRFAGSSRCRQQTETPYFSLCPNHQARKPPQLS